MANGVPHRLDISGLIELWETEPVPRLATGVKNRVPRLKALGNAVVPLQFYPIFKAIADIESGAVNAYTVI